MSGRCRHDRAIWIPLGEPSDWSKRAMECQDCGEWLPLGHSDETPERVAIEIRAATLAADMIEGVGIGGHRPDHCDGEHCWHWSADDGPCCYCDEDYRHEDYGLYMECHVGHLANVIATHKETP